MYSLAVGQTSVETEEVDAGQSGIGDSSFLWRIFFCGWDLAN
jgi:hypothetical protein